MSENRYRIKAVYTAGLVLGEIANSPGPISSAEIAAALDIDQNMAFRQCCTLEELGFARQNGDKKFELGMKLALFWARKKSSLEGKRDKIDSDLRTLNEENEA